MIVRICIGFWVRFICKITKIIQTFVVDLIFLLILHLNNINENDYKKYRKSLSFGCLCVDLQGVFRVE